MADMEEAARTAKNMPTAEPNFRNLRLNQRIAADEIWIGYSRWKPCEYNDFDWKDYEDRICYGGLDLSYGRDLTACAWVFPNYDGTYDAVVDFWKPGKGIEEVSKADGAPYDIWAKQGFLNLTEGEVIRLEPVALRMAYVADCVNLMGIAYDRYRHRELAQDLSDMGIDLPMIEHPQGFRRMPRASDGKGDFIKGEDGKPIENPLWMPTSAQELENLIVEQKIRIAFNPLLYYNASCVVLRHDPSGVGNFIFNKDKSKGRIDGVVALAMGVGYAKLHPPNNVPSVYESRGVLTF